jgi:soluble lytic murein transglycosylase-like protein
VDFGEQILFNPVYNIRLGCRYLAGLVETYGIEAGLAGYNGGERCAEIWQRKGTLPRETVFYVPSILKIYRNSSGGD